MLLQQFCGSAAISAYAARIFDKAGKFPGQVTSNLILYDVSISRF